MPTAGRVVAGIVVVVLVASLMASSYRMGQSSYSLNPLPRDDPVSAHELAELQGHVTSLEAQLQASREYAKSLLQAQQTGSSAPVLPSPPPLSVPSLGPGGRISMFFNNLDPKPYNPNPRHAIVTLATAHHWVYAVAFFSSCREVGTRVPNLVLLMPDTSSPLEPDVAAVFAGLGVEVRTIPQVPISQNAHIPAGWDVAWNKLGIWRLTDFDSVLYSDADTILVQNLDHFLDLPELSSPYTPGNCACNDAQGLPTKALFPEPVNFYAVGSGMFVAKPSMKRYDQFMECMRKPSPDPIDQHQYQGDWHWGDMEMLRVVFDQLEDSWHPLPYGTDVVVNACDCKWLEPYNITSLHFACNAESKPWGTALKDVYTMRSRCQFEAYYAWMYLFSKAMNAYSPQSVPMQNWRMQNGPKPSDGLTRAEVIREFEPTAAGQLPLHMGDIITVEDQSTENWWSGVDRDGNHGVFPSSFVRVQPKLPKS